MNRTGILLVGCVFLNAHDPTKADKARLQGSWRLSSMEAKEEVIGGEEAKKEKIGCVISGNKFLFTQGRQTYEHLFKVNPRGKPPTLDIIYPDEKGINHAIYRLEGNKLTIWWCPAIVAKCGFPRVFEPSV